LLIVVSFVFFADKNTLFLSKLTPFFSRNFAFSVEFLAGVV